MKLDLLQLTLPLALATASFTAARAQAPAAPTPATTAPATAAETVIDPRVAAKSVNVAAAERLIAEHPDLVILDVRTEREFAAGHLKKAVNLSSRAEDFPQKLAQLDRTKKYLVHSAGGGSRVTKTLEIFDQLGFTNWVNLDGGYKAWTNAAKPVVP